MLNAAVLVCGLAFAAPADKVDLSHNFAKGTSLAYDIKLETSGDPAIAAKATLTWAYGDKDDKGVKTSVKTSKVSIIIDGQDQTEDIPETTFLLDTSGMPDAFDMDGPQALLVIAHVATYLPAKGLEPGTTFDVDWKRDAATLKGTGRFEGMEKVEGKDLAKLTYKLALSPSSDAKNQGTLEFVSYFDPATGHVKSAKRTGSVDTHDFKFELATSTSK